MKATKNKIWDYIGTGLLLLVVTIIFSALSMVFFMDVIPKAVMVVFGFVFMAPIIIAAFFIGKNKANSDIGSKRKSQNSGIPVGQATFSGAKTASTFTPVHVPYYKCLFYTISFIVPILLILLLSVALKNIVLQGIIVIVLMPVTLVFSGTGAFVSSAYSPITLAIYIPFTLLFAAAFVVGYIMQLKVWRRHQREIAGELRMFDN